MDRNIVYPGSIPLDTDILYPNRNSMIGLGALLQAAFGTSTVVNGLAGTQTTVPSMTINVGPGSIIALEEVDPNAYGSLGANTAPLMKQGINLSATPFTLTAPTTSGQSINYLIEAEFVEADGTPVVLPYVNPANPAQPYSGPSNTGAAQNTVRAQTVGLQLKAGAPATTGTQTTPATDAGWVPLYVVTVNYGQTTVTTAQITPVSGAPFIDGAGTGRGIQPGRLLNIKIFPNSGTYTPTPGTNSIIVDIVGGGGGSGGIPATSSTQTGISSAAVNGAYAKAQYTSGFSGVAVTVGVGGIYGTPTTSGGNGGTSSFGSLVSCPGGAGSPFGVVSSGAIAAGDGASTSIPTGSGILYSTQGIQPNTAVQVSSGIASNFNSNSVIGPVPGSNFGRGANGGYLPVSSAATNGGTGYSGVIIVWEYS